MANQFWSEPGNTEMNRRVKPHSHCAPYGAVGLLYGAARRRTAFPLFTLCMQIKCRKFRKWRTTTTHRQLRTGIYFARTFYSTELYKQRIRKDFLWVYYSGRWFKCPRVLKLTQFLAGGSKWFKACVGAHNLQNRSWSDLFMSSATAYRSSTSCASLCTITAIGVQHATVLIISPLIRQAFIIARDLHNEHRRKM